MSRHVVNRNDWLFKPKEGSVPYVSDSKNSRIAASAVKAKAPTQKQQVYDHIKSCGLDGVCDFEGIGALVGVISSVQNAYRARRIELANEGKIKERKQGRMSQSGLPVTVWIDASIEDTTKGE